MRVALKMMLVFSVNPSSSSVNFDMSTLMAPVWRQATEKFDGSSLRPSGWPHPPFRACETWQVTPGTFGSSKSATHTLSLGERKLNVVLIQLNSSARAKAGTATKSTAAIKHVITSHLLTNAPANSNAVDRPKVPSTIGTGSQEQPDQDRLALLKKNRSISRDASGPSGSVYEPSGLPPDQPCPSPSMAHCSTYTTPRAPLIKVRV